MLTGVISGNSPIVQSGGWFANTGQIVQTVIALVSLLIAAYGFISKKTWLVPWVGIFLGGILVSYVYSKYFTPSPPPYVNALRSDSAKWNIVHGARLMIKNNPKLQSCHALIFRLQEPYAEELATDLKSILDTIGWTYEERFASSTIGKEITVRPIDQQPSRLPMTDGFQCGYALWAKMSDDSIKAKNGKTPGALRQYYLDDAPEFLKQCGQQCFEIEVGNEAVAD
jgi:hypothetical protein